MALTLFVLLLVSVFSQALTEKCLTPNNEQAECISLYTCPVLIGALATQQKISIEFVRNSTCGHSDGSNPMVCCGTLSTFTGPLKNVTDTTMDRVSTVNALSDRRYCGYQHSDDYVSGGNDTGIDEFPWLALLLFTEDDRVSELCSGSLINRRYVLTAAQCVLHPFYNVSIIRLGDYNIKTTTDCVKNPTYEECNEPPKEYGVEKTIPHPLYSLGNSTNNIGLIRLNKTVQFSDFIRPICLPTPGTTFAKIGDTLTTSGWGRREIFDASSGKKKKILTQLLSNDACLSEYNNTRNVISENNLCTKELSTSLHFSCHGDSGRPLIFSHRNQWHQEGVASFGKSCNGHTPDVYTKVANYLDWIAENIEP